MSARNKAMALRLEMLGMQPLYTSQTCFVTINDETHSINEWCRIKGIGYHVIKQRRKRGMSIEDAITTPLNESKRGRKR